MAFLDAVDELARRGATLSIDEPDYGRESALTFLSALAVAAQERVSVTPTMIDDFESLLGRIQLRRILLATVSRGKPGHTSWPHEHTRGVGVAAYTTKPR
ncbi:MAG: hypothetical protein U0R77_00555 [Mycolicibacterium insubricum]